MNELLYVLEVHTTCLLRLLWHGVLCERAVTEIIRSQSYCYKPWKSYKLGLNAA